MTTLVVTDTKRGWRYDRDSKRRRYIYKALPSAVRIRSMMRDGKDTVAIAAEFGVTEAEIWNALARAGA